MRKGLFTVLTVLCLATLAGCSKDKPGEQSGETTKAATSGKKEYQFVSEDYEPGNKTKYLNAMMKTDKGVYHYTYEDNGLHYYDLATKKMLFLCNKPECRHDGNEFCVATNRKYIHLNQCLYNDVILKYAAEETDTQYRFKVLSVALDGSAMNEIATTLEFAKPTEGFAIYQCFMYAHRNKVFLTMAGAGQAEQEEFHGAVILDLNTKEVTYLEEEPFSKDNIEITSISAYGDYFYYCKKEGKKLLLHRYHIENGTDESFRLLPNFDGQYVVLDEDLIAYIKSTGTMVCTYRISTGQNTEQTKVMRQFYEPQWDGTWEKSEKPRESVVSQLVTDGTYIYAAEGPAEYVEETENGEKKVIRRDAYIHVFNRDLEEIMLVDMAEASASLGFDDIEWELKCYTQTLHYMGEDIYWKLTPKGTMDFETYSENYVFRCNRDDFIAGEPKFEFVYQYNGY